MDGTRASKLMTFAHPPLGDQRGIISHVFRMQVLGDSAIRLSWGRSAVAARPAGQLRSFNPVAYPTAAFGGLQPAAAAAYAAPFGYGIGQPAGMPTSLYPGLPQVCCSKLHSLNPPRYPV